MSLILSGTDGLSDVDGTAATPAIRGTDANTGIFFPAADTIAFAEGGVEAARIDSAGNLGLGVTPNAWDSTWVAVDLLYGGSIGSGNYGTRSLHIFNNSYASSAGYKFSGTGYASSYYQTAGQHNWRSTAATGVADGAATFTTVLSLAGVDKTLALQGGGSGTGIGITFPATQSASTDANTLDDYEEGTWTPVVSDAAGGGNLATLDAGSSSGVYTKIGNIVYWRFSVVLTSKASMTAGNEVFIQGFPFTSAAIAGNWYNPFPTIIRNITFTGYVQFHQAGSSQYGYFRENVSGAAGDNIIVSDLTDSAAMQVSGFYRVA